MEKLLNGIAYVILTILVALLFALCMLPLLFYKACIDYRNYLSMYVELVV